MYKANLVLFVIILFSSVQGKAQQKDFEYYDSLTYKLYMDKDFKPLLKAGNAYYKMKAKNKLWPRSSASAMNAVDHPFGNKRTSRKSKARPISKNAPPGRKVGTVAARRTGRKKR